MAVIPLTLTISLCLVFTFVIFFLREQMRPRFGSSESDALLPLAEEGARPVTPRPAGSSSSVPHDQVDEDVDDHDHDHECGCHSGRRAPCAGCLKASATL